MDRTRPDVKICGVCDPSDAAMAVEAGATHVGVIRVSGSRRARPADVARAVCAAAEGARTVGVYVNASLSTMVEEAGQLGLDTVQLHGSEPPGLIDELRVEGLEVWKVLKPSTGPELVAAAERYGAADLLLVEGRSARGHGGVGARFPWEELESAVRAVGQAAAVGVGGGLNASNVAEAVRRFRPRLVDVSSGVEREVCAKDPSLVRSFIDAARGGRGRGVSRGQGE